MIGYLKGNVLSKNDSTAIIECNGIGFEVTCSSLAFDSLKKDEIGELFIYTAVREDGIFLYGFLTQEEKSMFLKLISVSGVGPKMGITILSNIDLTSLVVAIAKSDVKTLSKVKGLGKKTAERIIVELREKVSASDMEEKVELPQEVTTADVNNDALIALMSFGFTKVECVTALNKAIQSGITDIEKQIAFALKNIK